VTEYSGLSPNAEPTGIAVSGNNIWFVEVAADGFGRLKVDTGEITERFRPSGSMPQEMVVTEAGNLWWTETGGNRIVSFAPSTLTFGTTVTAPTANSAPFGVTIEGNQAVWFTEQAANKLARWHRLFTPPVEFPLPTPNSAPTAIVIDGAGCAWYTAPATNRIGRLCLARIHLPSIPRAGP
jgi:virginiamycin B lyase